MNSVLIIGIGNAGRADDGLGWAFLDRVKAKYPDGKIPLSTGDVSVYFDLEYRYQLQVEDAELICQYKKVVYIDATEEVHEDGFAIRECASSGNYHYSSHIQSPESVLYLSEVLFGKKPEALIVSITGFDWDLGNRMGVRASENLDKALHTFIDRYFLPVYKEKKPKHTQI